MTSIEQQLIETWQIHNRICIFVIEQISDDALKSTLSTHGGRDIARQLAHLHTVRVSRLATFAKKTNTELLQFENDESPEKARLLSAFAQSGEVMESYIRSSLQNDGVVSNFKRGVVPMIGYFISHEAHHRGSILLTMKQNGFKLSTALRYGIWEWNKI